MYQSSSIIIIVLANLYDSLKLITIRLNRHQKVVSFTTNPLQVLNYKFTPKRSNVALHKITCQKESSLPTKIFEGLCSFLQVGRFEVSLDVSINAISNVFRRKSYHYTQNNVSSLLWVLSTLNFNRFKTCQDLSQKHQQSNTYPFHFCS